MPLVIGGIIMVLLITYWGILRARKAKARAAAALAPPPPTVVATGATPVTPPVVTPAPAPPKRNVGKIVWRIAFAVIAIAILVGLWHEGRPLVDWLSKPQQVQQRIMVFRWWTPAGEYDRFGVSKTWFRADIVKNDSSAYWVDLYNHQGNLAIRLRLKKSGSGMMVKLTGSWQNCWRNHESGACELNRVGTGWTGQMMRGGRNKPWSCSLFWE